MFNIYRVCSWIALVSILTLLVPAAGLTPAAKANADVYVTIDGNDTGRIFEGIGAVFSNGMTKLIRDYPPEQRADILDLLFKPKFGASLQHVKVEIGSDANTSAGTEPSHKRSRDDFDIKRGAGLWLAQQAKAIHPGITLEALRWGTPAWIQNDQDKYEYYRSFLDGAFDEFGLTFDFLGADANEDEFSRDWVVNTLRPNLDADGYQDLKITAADSNLGWWIAEDIQYDTELKNALHAINAHYTQSSTAAAKNSGLPLYSSENLAPFRTGFVNGTLEMAYRMITMYTEGRMVMYQMHPAAEAAYPNTPFNYKGIMVTQWPWSGYYEVLDGLWATAHFTQFIEPGWQYLDNGSGSDYYGAYVSLRDPGSDHWSLIITNISAVPKTYRFKVTGGLNTGPVHVWRTTEHEHFIQLDDIMLSGDEFEVTIEPFSIYSFTTTTGQQKGQPAHPIPESTEFTLDYFDDFDAYEPGQQPLFASDQGGAFEIANTPSGKVLEQQLRLTEKPRDWKYRPTPEPFTLLGSLEWRNYEMEVDANLNDAVGYLMIGGRVNHTGKDANPPNGYLFYVYEDNATWALRKGTETLQTGVLNGFSPNQWNKYKMRFENNQITVFFNDAAVASIIDDDIPSGHIALGSGYNHVQFDNLAIRALDQQTAVSVKRFEDKDPRLLFEGVWSDENGNYDTYSRSLRISDKAGSELRLRFRGTGISIVGVKDAWGGQADVYVDGQLAETIDAYSEETLYRRSLFTIDGLGDGDHTLRLVVKGARQAKSSGNYIKVDAVEVLGGTLETILVPVLYENFDDGTVMQPPAGWNISADADTAAMTAAFPSTQNKSLQLIDANASGKVSASRTFQPLSGEVIARFRYYTAETEQWSRFFIGKGSQYAVEIYDTDAHKLSYKNQSGGKTTIMEIEPNTWYSFEVILNTETGTFSLSVNDAVYVENAPFADGISLNSLDTFHVQSGEGFENEFYIDDVEIGVRETVSRTVIYDTFDSTPYGSIPPLWTVTGNRKATCTVSPVPSPADLSLKCYDEDTSGAVQAKRYFDRRSTGKVIWEFSILYKQTGGWERIFLRDEANPGIELYHTNNGLEFRDKNGIYHPIMPLAANTWYHVKIAADLDNKTFDLFINGSPLLLQEEFTEPRIHSLDNIRIGTGTGPASTFYLNNVRVTIQ